ncbi:MAG TPA: RNase adapter RapZ, partial [Nitrospirota bacterium]|nr:RNase adapter RapZ [Nitrospirota bacterium]
DYTVHDLRQSVERRFSGPGGSRPLMVTIVTFGYKYGIPYELDLLFDVRFLPNPHFVEELRPLTGLQPPVSDFVMGKQESGEFIEKLIDFLAYLLPRYRSEGKSYLNVGFGCTGGRHRSVAISLVVAERLRKLGFDVNLKHRDVGT